MRYTVGASLGVYYGIYSCILPGCVHRVSMVCTRGYTVVSSLGVY